MMNGLRAVVAAAPRGECHRRFAQRVRRPSKFAELGMLLAISERAHGLLCFSAFSLVGGDSEGSDLGVWPSGPPV